MYTIDYINYQYHMCLNNMFLAATEGGQLRDH